MKIGLMRQASRGPALLTAAAFAAFLTGWAWPVMAQFPDLDSPTECPGCRPALEALAQTADPRPTRSRAKHRRGVIEHPALAGTWSSPLTSADDRAWAVEDFLCFVACTPGARTAATALLREPATAAQPAVSLLPRIIAFNLKDAMSVRKRAAPPAGSHLGPVAAPPGSGNVVASASFGANVPASKPSCEPFGFATQVVSPLPLKIDQYPGRVVFHYEEFGAERTVLFDGRGDPSAAASLPLGLSRGRFEGDAFVVETDHIRAGRFYDWFGGDRYSNKLRATESYTTSTDGRWLNLTLRLEDPETLEAPLILVKRWRRADVEILPYSCDAISGQR